MFTLTACGSNNANNNNSGADNTISNSPKESVQLSAGNFSKYVAVNSTVSLIYNEYNSVVYYSYFNGADYCKFINCTVTYSYLLNGGGEGNQYTVPLTLSGDGQSDPFFVSRPDRYTYYSIKIIGASGTVEVYR